MRPDRIEIALPSRGFTWLQDEASSGSCDEVPAGKWTRRPAGNLDLFVCADGPSGSGRYWNVTVGVGERQSTKPVRGVCLITSTVGFRTLQRYKEIPLAWLDDLDKDGRSELILWSSFPLREESTLAEYGMVAWVYRLASKDSLAIDWALSQKMAREVAQAYRSGSDPTAASLGRLRTEAAEALERFADKRCLVQQNVR
jgi:hypothetical protein